MENNKKNKELQSRREFFKNAAKGALPILGAVLLASAPVVTQAAEEPMGCNHGCIRVCSGSLCQGTCQGGCKFTCARGCGNYGCKGVNKA